MPIQLLCAALALAALLLAAPPAPATSVGNVAPPSVGVVALPDGGSDRTDILFQTGLAAIAAAGRPGLPEDTRDALLNEAVANFRAILIDRPGLVRVRLELARAFFLKGEDALARRHFEWVLAGNPPQAVVANVNRFIALMRARKRWSAYFGLAVAPDSNINTASDSDIINIYIAGERLAFRRDVASKARSGLGMAVWGGGEYEHPLTDRLRLRAGANVARREYRGRDFDHTSVGVHLGPRWLVDADTEVSLLAEAQRQWIGGKPNSDTMGLRIEAGHRLSRRISLNASAAWRERDHRDNDLDGPVTALSLGVAWAVTQTLRLSAALGHDRVLPKKKARRSTGLWLRVGAEQALPRGFTVGASVRIGQTVYEGGDAGPPHNTRDGRNRVDRTRTLSVTVLNRGLTVLGFSPQVVLVNEVQTTNAQAQDYKRNRAELRLVRQF